MRSSLVCSTGGRLWLFHCCVCTVLAMVSFPWNLVTVYTYTAAIIFQHHKIWDPNCSKKSYMDLFYGRGLMMAVWS